MSLKVLMVGCGNIAGGFDTHHSTERMPFSHAGAYARHGGFNVVACIDPDLAKRQAFMRRWSVEYGFDSIEDVAEDVGHYAVISICSPTNSHYHDVRVAMALKPRLIFCEKPVTPSVAQTAELVELCKTVGILLVINHTRRWDADVVRLSDELRVGVWGAIRSATGFYNKGILNNGSHMLDLLLLLLGKLEVRSVGIPVFDMLSDDPTIPAHLVACGDIDVQLACGHAQDFSLFELQIVTEKGVICMEEGGLYWRIRGVIESQNFPGYRVLGVAEYKVGALPGATLAAVTEIHAALTQGGPISSTGENALAAQRLSETIRNMAGV